MNDTNYLWEFLTSETNLIAVSVAIIASAFALVAGHDTSAGIMLLWTGVAELVAGFVVPSLPSFRFKVNHRQAKEKRTAEIKRLVLLLQGQEYAGDLPEVVQDYSILQTRIESINKLAEDNSTTISQEIADKIAETEITYLAYWLAIATLKERKHNMDVRYLTTQIAELDKKLRGADLSPSDKKKLQKAQQDYKDAKSSFDKIDIKLHSIDSARLAMLSKVEDIYQQVLSQPSNPELPNALQDSLAQLQMEEEIQQDLAEFSTVSSKASNFHKQAA